MKEKPAVNPVQKALIVIFPFWAKFIQELVDCHSNYKKANLGFLAMIREVFIVFRSVSIFFFLNMLILILFVLFPAGKDILLVVIEDLSKWHPGSFIGLFISLAFWAVISEFSAQYMIYVTDNSGYSLADHEVNWRKAIQKLLSFLFLALPFFIIAVSILILYLRNYKSRETELNLALGMSLLVLYVCYRILALIYFRVDNEGKVKPISNSLSYWRIGDDERKWLGKLYGIYNGYTFNLANFSIFNKSKGLYTDFLQSSFEAVKSDKTNNIPQSEVFEEDFIPPKFKIGLPYPSKPNFQSSNEPQNLKWYYTIPKNFYKGLHRRLFTVIIVSFVILIIHLLAPEPVYVFIGSAGIVCTAFAVWCGLYLLLIFLDFRYKILFPRFFRLVLPVAIITICSIVNDDHPLRIVNNESQTSNVHPSIQRIALKQHFNNYLNAVNYDSIRPIPVYFICAEGGGLRTGYFASAVLNELQKRYRDTLGLNFSFYNRVYAFSSVSGGTLGTGVFQGICQFAPSLTDISYLDSSSQSFFNKDFLAVVLGKMLFGEVVNLFWPCNVDAFNRVNALERSWESSFGAVAKRGNVFSESFLAAMNRSTNNKAWFINTAEMERGWQSWITNVVADPSWQCSDQRDLLHPNSGILGGRQINYSTAMGMSARFPLISPSAAVSKGKVKLHFLDGGYVENSGAATMKYILTTLLGDSIHRPNIIPIVVQINWSIDDGRISNQDINGPLDIISGIYNARIGRTTLAQRELKDYVEKELKGLKGYYVPIGLGVPEKDVPTNWILSERAQNKIRQSALEEVRKNEMKLFIKP